jgi:hypothetical protein
MDELFPVEQSLSPRLKWMQKHRIQVRRNEKVDEELGQWEVWQDDYGKAADIQMSRTGDLDGPYFVAATSEDEAITQFALSNKLKLWNEE